MARSEATKRGSENPADGTEPPAVLNDLANVTKVAPKGLVRR
jgi:hypothetical protein